MKKVLIISTLTVIFLASCKKDRVCTCTTTPVSGPTVTYTVTYFQSHKRNAREACEMQATETDVTAPTSQKGDKTTCTLK